MSSQRALEIFGSFFINESEFALPVKHVQEVVHPPERYASVPLSPDYLRGLFNLRGTIIPVLDLRALLNLGGESESQKIAIIELDGFYLGLLFDRTGEIFRAHDEERSHFNEESGGVISGAFKRDEGRRLLQILDVPALLRLKNIPHEATGESGPARLRQLAMKRGQRRQCISFLVGPARCAFRIDGIQEILKVGKLSQTALSGDKCVGSLDLRGVTVPVIDFATLLRYRATPGATDGDRRIVVMKLGPELFGLLVDSVESIVTYYEDELLKFSSLQKEKSEIFIGCIAKEGAHEILLLDHTKVLDDAEVREITHGHARLYQTTSSSAVTKAAVSARKTYITFTIENRYAVGIEQVREILDLPGELMRPPGLPAHCKGVLNLRGELITIVDARTMYGKSGAQDVKGKILVFRDAASPFGLVVDSVDEIVSFTDQSKIKFPELLLRSAGEMAKDVLSAVELNSDPQKCVMILDAQAIVARVSPAA